MNTPTSVLLLDRVTVASLLGLDDCIVAVESAFAAHARGQSMAPALIHVDADGGEFHVKAGGLLGARAYFACKINGSFFGNRPRFGLPNIVGLILLCDGANGLPLAVMDSGLVTRLRTAAATAVAAKYLASPTSRTITICGAGVQAEAQLRALAQVLPIRNAFVWSRSGANALAQSMTEQLQLDVRAVADLTTAAQQSDVIVTCTPAKHWYLGRKQVRAGAFVAAVGADSPDKTEIEPELLAAASVVCDLTAQCAQVGDLHHAIAAGHLNAGQVRGELGDVIIGKVPRRLRADEIIIFDSTGTALQDAAAAAAVYESALSKGAGETFSFLA
jgi:alanine dehydrogenase